MGDTSPDILDAERAGFTTYLVPLIPPDAPLAPGAERLADKRGKIPGTLWPTGNWTGRKDWQDETTDVAKLVAWKSQNLTQFGMRTGQGPGYLVAIDVDVTDPQIAAALERAIIETLGQAPRRIGNAPKFLLLYRSDTPFKKLRLVYAKGESKQAVEVLGEGQQFVVDGIHPKTQNPYVWDTHPFAQGVNRLLTLTDNSLQKLQECCEFVFDAYGYDTAHRSEGGDREEPQDPTALVGDPATVKQALRALGNEFDYDDWIKMCVAVKGALGSNEEHYPIYEDWCLEYAENTPEIAREKWDSVKRPHYGAAYIYHEAQAKGWGGGSAHAELDFKDAPLPPEPVHEAPQKRRRGLHLVHYRDAEARPDLAQPWLVRDYLPMRGTGVIYGAPNSGKTFVGIDLAMAIATGTTWAGKAATAGSVAYVAAEAGDSAKKRLEAYRISKRPPGDAPFMLVPCRTDLRRPEGDTNGLIALIRQGVREKALPGLRLVVIDTLARAMAGGNENAAEDMGALYDNVALISEALDCFVLLVHHTGKDQAKGARGHSLLLGNVDFEAEMTAGRLRVTKARDMDKGALDAAFTLPVVRIGKDNEGEVVTSCVVEWAVRGAGDFAKQPVPPEAMQHYEVLETLVAEKAMREGVEEGEAVWIDLVAWNVASREQGRETPTNIPFSVTKMSVTPDMPKSTERVRVLRLRSTLEEAGWVKKNLQGQWTTT